AVRASPPLAAICLATASKLAFVRPAKKTRTPSAANSFATAAPMEPPAPKTTAFLSCKTRVFMSYSDSSEAAGVADPRPSGLGRTETFEENGSDIIVGGGGLS